MSSRPPSNSTWRIAAASIILLAGAAAAQQAPPPAMDPPGQPLPDAPAPADAQAEAAPADAAQSNQSHAATETPGLSVIARWIRASGCRVFLALPIDADTRFSPDVRDHARTQGRISLPSFVAARISFTHGSAAPDVAPALDTAAAPAEGEAATGDPAVPTTTAEAGDPALVAPTAAETAVAAAPPPPPPPTWTQRVGLVKSNPAAAPAGDAAAQLTWTQKVGLVKAPVSGSGSPVAVSSFKKAKPASSAN